MTLMSVCNNLSVTLLVLFSLHHVNHDPVIEYRFIDTAKRFFSRAIDYCQCSRALTRLDQILCSVVVEFYQLSPNFVTFCNFPIKVVKQTLQLDS
jgi:hypothetical protein